MTRRELETILLTLESTPALLARAAAELHEDRVRQRGTAGGFSLVEHVWLTEEEPRLPNFDGERVARERVYHRRDLVEGLLAFTAARIRNLETLRGLSPADWRRTGEQEGVGLVALADVPRMMAEHDRAHGIEIAELVREIRDGFVPRSAPPVSAVA